MTAVSNERSPLLRATSPSNGTKLNPMAASFSFAPKAQNKKAPAPISYAQVAAKPPPAPVAAPQPAVVAPAAPVEAASAAAPSTAQAQAQPQQQQQPPAPQQPQTTPTVSIHSATPSRPKSPTPSTHSSASCHSCSSQSTSSSLDSLLPSRRAFHRAHLLVQFPISFLLVSGAFVALSVWKREVRLTDLLLGGGSWLASESLKEIVFAHLTREAVDRETGEAIRGTGLGVPTLVHAIVQEGVRLGGIICCVGLLPEVTVSVLGGMPLPPPAPPPRTPGHGRKPLPPLDTLFFSALWFALGWAAVEILWGSRDFWRRMKLYDDVLVDKEVDEEELDGLREEAREHANYGTLANGNGKGRSDEGEEDDSEADEEEEEERALELAVDDAAIEERIRALEREEVEGQLGVPLFDIPVGVVLIWRVDSILLSLVLTLVLSLPFRTSAPTLVRFPLWPTFTAAAVAHAFISLLWVARIRYVGIPSVSYITLVLLLFATFGGLAAWGALE